MHYYQICHTSAIECGQGLFQVTHCWQTKLPRVQVCIPISIPMFNEPVRLLQQSVQIPFLSVARRNLPLLRPVVPLPVLRCVVSQCSTPVLPVLTVLGHATIVTVLCITGQNEDKIPSSKVLCFKCNAWLLYIQVCSRGKIAMKFNELK